ncbi:hypothetical protein [Mycoplasmopsis agassizii]|uniref:Lipoprotein n=1 Tax=Mycoplasmopsis agassizii TaxID=33922 RepID=A0ABX4H4R9_9BACT|nr:hypothetical protein [Mycoplasmopsis agassizii]PAF54886.1 hypothetical protein CJF60_04075 [Mycoplasmopsis agassizii]SMC17297.1 hypothetical protein SAMN02745179_00438 [Mycoplasmopsis agassizii]
MSLVSKKLLFAISTTSLFISASVAISCSNFDENDFFETNFFNTVMLEQSIDYGTKKIKVGVFDPEMISEIYDEDFDKLEPALISTNYQLKEFVEKWRQLILKHLDVKQRVVGASLEVRKKVENKLEKAINLFTKNYDAEFFKKNIVIIDFGGKIQPLGPDEKIASSSAFKINNLHKIKVEGNQITLEYFSEK